MGWIKANGFDSCSIARGQIAESRVSFSGLMISDFDSDNDSEHIQSAVILRDWTR